MELKDPNSNAPKGGQHEMHQELHQEGSEQHKGERKGMRVAF
jgi:hypothetical protein